MNTRRITVVAILSVFVLIMLIARVLYLQTAEGVFLADGAAQAQAVDVPLNVPRGDIFDARGLCLTRNYNACVAVVFPGELSDKSRAARLIAQLSGLKTQEVAEQLSKGVLCRFLLNTTKEKAQAMEGLKGVRLFESYRRYGPDSLACHLIGYIDNGSKGVFGLEKAYDSVLSGGKSRFVRFLTDAGRHRPFDGTERLMSNGEDKGIALTIDYRVQKAAEEALASRSLKGAVIVTDAKNADVLAIASSPKFEQGVVGEYIGRGSGELVDRSAMAYEPGSVFKLVLVAAALEDGLDPLQLRFNCSGYQQIGDVRINCHKPEGHGEEDLVRALANSCNPAFIQLGDMLGAQRFAEMAKRLGFGRPVTLYNGQSSAAGDIPVKPAYAPAEAANMSIGQGDIQVTPLQVASLLDTIANGGKRRALNVVKGETDSRGRIVKELGTHSEEQVISPSTAGRLAQMMHEVTVNGTASNGNLEALGGAAAKTGTAQSGWLAPDGSLMMHAWFAGFFPLDAPRFCITVFIENGRQGNNVAGAVFREIAEKINNLDIEY